MPPIEIKTARIDKLTSELDEHKACGPDGIRPIILKRLRAANTVLFTTRNKYDSHTHDEVVTIGYELWQNYIIK